MGCLNSKDDTVRTDRRREVPTGPDPRLDGTAEPVHGGSTASAAVSIGGGEARGGAATRAGRDDEPTPLSESLIERNRERARYNRIVTNAHDDFIDVSQTVLEMEPEEAIDEGMVDLREQLVSIKLPSDVSAAPALPRAGNAQGDALYNLLSAPPLAAGQLATVERGANSVAGAVKSMEAVPASEPIVVAFSLGG